MQGNYSYWLVALLIVLAMFAAFAALRRAARGRAAQSWLGSLWPADGEARFRSLAEAIPQIVWTALPDGAVDYCNRRWYEATGFSEAESMGQDGRTRSIPTIGRWPWRSGRMCFAPKSPVKSNIVCEPLPGPIAGI